ncbi:HAMP domain-containing sensor histidine kinase [Nocardioides sp.]|uniref:HAMP domain-containing sensor histidine kinase n=1 Tax=Nocardioides sp. TaxID=35761 RepID=UPI002F411403
MLAIPVVLAAVFGGLRVSSELQDASAYSTNQQRATVLGPAIDYLTATERLALPAELSARLGGGDAKSAWSAASARLKNAASKADLTASENNDVTTITQIGTTLESGSGTGITATAPVQLSDMTRLTNDLINSTLNTAGTPDSKVQALVQALNGRLSLVKQQLLIQSNDQEPSQLGSVWLAAEIGVESTALDDLKSGVGASVGGRRVELLSAANGTRLGLATSNKIEDLSAGPKMFERYDVVNKRLLGSIQSTLATNASQAKSRALTDAAVILTALLASLLLALFVARALILPLRKVRAGALAVANERLPETVARIRSGKAPDEVTPIPVHSHEELGQLARAVDDMHKQAVSLATGEAQLRTQVGAMFVTLSRRNTTLVNQQLALIESLEQDEEDPQRLEQLFSLDHLATRMRRTAESLVILGGAEGRTAGFEELSVSDVVHAAVSEVQDYQRVRIDAAPDRMIAGRAASDIVHLMAELIDNALSYSPPGSPVTIQAAEDGGKVEIEIIDNGLGMAGDALAQANDSLKNGGEVTVDTARRMGLFVVSRLAEEHGLKVKLGRNTNGGGIIASILLPSAVLVSDSPVEHVSILDAPEPAGEPVAPVVDEEPEEEYDPYLERIEEAIAAVTGLPRRRPGQTPGPAQPAAPAASVGMFDAGPTPELPPGFEPTELPGLTADVSEDEQPGEPVPIALPAAVHELRDVETDEDADVDSEDTDEGLAEVVTPQFGAERQLVAVLDSDDSEEAAEESDEPELVTAELETEEQAEEPTEDQSDEQAEEPEVAPYEVTQHEVAQHGVAEPEVEPVPASPWGQADSQGWGTLPEPEPVPAAAAEVAGEPAYDAPEPVVASAEPAPHEVAVEEAPVRLQIRRPLSAARAASALEGEFVAETEKPGDSPIFGQLRSNWLSDAEGDEWSASEVDRGWNAAERAESGDSDGTTRTGLPVRRPGGRLVPGGVSQEPAKVVRDPEAIRNRLAAHAAGVSRGRAAAAEQPTTFDYAHEETGPA